MARVAHALPRKRVRSLTLSGSGATDEQAAQETGRLTFHPLTLNSS
jgi:hypothetical protein